eukprot:1866532-Alexandrium_andersonii.AAC.1
MPVACASVPMKFGFALHESFMSPLNVAPMSSLQAARVGGGPRSSNLKASLGVLANVCLGTPSEQ